ncbi:2OG-Fe(II) oxygenase family protein [Synechococcus elongatus]|uniref:2OG-Fe(II) oxygenase family protein n=1 Tax=Synechococcus elongatus TaxID=32046 RepID=UPI000F7F35CE|nr:2OG-Fe(II) oxygenase family protein [Synechococcus elongatus]
MPIDTWFPLAVSRNLLTPDPALHERMVAQIFQWRGDLWANPSGESAWTGDMNGVALVHEHPDFAWLRSQVEVEALQFCQALGFQTEALQLWIQRSWPVVSEPGQSIGAHHHPNAHLSAIYYLNGSGDPELGALRIFDDRPRNELVPGLAVGYGEVIAEEAALNQAWIDYPPQAGLLLLFPASTRHGVTENLTDLTRLSISFDLYLTARSATELAPEYLAPPVNRWSPIQLR